MTLAADGLRGALQVEVCEILSPVSLDGTWGVEAPDSECTALVWHSSGSAAASGPAVRVPAGGDVAGLVLVAPLLPAWAPYGGLPPDFQEQGYAKLEYLDDNLRGLPLSEAEREDMAELERLIRLAHEIPDETQGEPPP